MNTNVLTVLTLAAALSGCTLTQYIKRENDSAISTPQCAKDAARSVEGVLAVIPRPPGALYEYVLVVESKYGVHDFQVEAGGRMAGSLIKVSVADRDDSPEAAFAREVIHTIQTKCAAHGG